MPMMLMKAFVVAAGWNEVSAVSLIQEDRPVDTDGCQKVHIICKDLLQTAAKKHSDELQMLTVDTDCGKLKLEAGRATENVKACKNDVEVQDVKYLQLENKYKNNLQAHSNQLHKLETSWKNTIQAQSDQHQELETSCNNVTSFFDELQKVDKEKEEQIANLQVALETSNDRVTSLTDTKATQQAAINSYHSKIGLFEKQVADLQGLEESYEDQLDACYANTESVRNSFIAQLTEQHDYANTGCNPKLEEQLLESIEQADIANRQLPLLTQRAVNAETEIASYTTKINAAFDTLKSFNGYAGTREHAQAIHQFITAVQSTV